MKFATMVDDVVESFFKKPVTQLYPFEKTPAPLCVRGKLSFDPSACTGCGLCVKDCPADALELVTLDRAAKRFVMKYEMDHCIYCGQCLVSCRFKCLDLSSQNWELASLSKEKFTVYYGKDNDIRTVLAKFTAPAAESGSE
jgi:formate hydrogenlyase subunit 6/NADH:ubiquinone oxidoreductase subunit I